MTSYDKKYEDGLLAYFGEMLPEKLYDAHFHLYDRYAESQDYQDPVLQYRDFMREALGREIDGGLVMGSPSSRHTPELMSEYNEKNLDYARRGGFRAGQLIAPWNTKAEVAAALDANPEIAALKPYLTYSTAADRFESDISDFTPRWAFELADEREMPIVLHLSHYQDMLGDENNIRELRAFSQEYPHATIVLAHCAMGHHVRKLRLALPRIADLKNIRFDCSGASETMSVYYCLRTFGPECMMWGGDHNFGQTTGRIVSFGSNFFGLHPNIAKNVTMPGDYKYQPLSNTAECLLALLEAGELLGLTKSEWQAIFYDNAAAIYGK